MIVSPMAFMIVNAPGVIPTLMPAGVGTATANSGISAIISSASLLLTALMISLFICV